jgi:hypothetical protein
MCLLMELCECAEDCRCDGTACQGAICACYCVVLYMENIQNHSSREKRYFISSNQRFWTATLVCCYAFIAFILSSIALSALVKQSNVLQSSLENWQQDPIVDISIQSTY